MIFWISESFNLYLLVKNSFNFKLGFFTYFEYISGGIIRKNIYFQITMVPGDTSNPQNYWWQKAIAAEIAFQVKISSGKNSLPSLFSLKYNNQKKL